MDFKTIKSSLRTGQLFSVVFEKKDKTLRKMLCRTGVKKGITQDRKRAAHEEPEHILTVWDMQKGGYRSINLNTLIQIKLDGIVYKFN